MPRSLKLFPVSLLVFILTEKGYASGLSPEIPLSKESTDLSNLLIPPSLQQRPVEGFSGESSIKTASLVEAPKPLKILSIDGGGFGPLPTLLALARLEDTMDKPLGACFNVIAGSGFGAVIAALLCATKKIDINPRLLVRTLAQRYIQGLSTSPKTQKNADLLFLDYARGLLKETPLREANPVLWMSLAEPAALVPKVITNFSKTGSKDQDRSLRSFLPSTDLYEKSSDFIPKLAALWPKSSKNFIGASPDLNPTLKVIQMISTSQWAKNPLLVLSVGSGTYMDKKIKLLDLQEQRGGLSFLGRRVSEVSESHLSSSAGNSYVRLQPVLNARYAKEGLTSQKAIDHAAFRTRSLVEKDKKEDVETMVELLDR